MKIESKFDVGNEVIWINSKYKEECSCCGDSSRKRVFYLDNDSVGFIDSVLVFASNEELTPSIRYHTKFKDKDSCVVNIIEADIFFHTPEGKQQALERIKELNDGNF